MKRRPFVEILVFTAICLGLVVRIAWSRPNGPDWTGRGKYRLLATVPPSELNNRRCDQMPARMRIDFSEVLGRLGVEGRPDIGSIQVIRCDAATGAAVPCDQFRGRGPADVPFRFDDFDRRKYSFWYNIAGNGRDGELVWSHRQEGDAPSLYAIYFDVAAAGKDGEDGGQSPLPLLGDGDEDVLVSTSYCVCYLLERSFIEKGYAEATLVDVQKKN